MKISVECYYSVSSVTDIDLPNGMTWDDVTDHYVKWGHLCLKFKGSDTYQEFDLGDVSLDSLDYKYPGNVQIFSADDAGGPNYDDCLSEKEGAKLAVLTKANAVQSKGHRS